MRSTLIKIPNLPTHRDQNNLMCKNIMEIVCDHEKIALDPKAVEYMYKV